MDVFIFSDSNSLQKQLKIKSKNNKFNINHLPVNLLKKTLKAIQEQSLVYIDISGLNDKINSTLSYLSKTNNIFFGIIDLKGLITDIQYIVSLGAADYVNKESYKTAFTDKRFKDVIAYLKKYRKDYSEVKISIQKPEEYIVSKNGWKNISENNDFAFSIMFIEFDGIEEMKKKYGVTNLKTAINTFKNYILRHIELFGGKIWIWNGFGGIILFPFNGNECKSVFSGFRLMLYKHIYDIEESIFPNFISFRIALHLGNINYKEKNTGKIISNPINYIFHLGRKFTKPGNFFLTEDVFNYSPEPLKPFFTLNKNFEGKSIYKMKLPSIIE